MGNIEVEEKAVPLSFAAAIPDTWSAEKWADGIQIDELRPFDKLSIETMHHSYEITVMDPTTAEVLIRGGEYFPEATPAYLFGASLRSSPIKLHGIYAGFHMELLVDGRRIITSRVRRITPLAALAA